MHFPSWALSRRELALLDARSLAEAVARVAAAAPSRAAGSAGAAGATSCGRTGSGRTARRSTRSCPDGPVALRAHDSHSLWLNSAALALAGGDLETPGGVVERDADGEPTGILREEAAWRFEARFAPERAEALDAMRAAMPAVAAAGVVAVHDKDGGKGAPALFAAPGSRCASGSRCPPTRSRSRAATTSRPSWTARSARARRGCSTARGVEITSAEALAG